MSKSVQRYITDCFAALSQRVGLFQILDVNRAKRLRLRRSQFTPIHKP